MHEHQVFHRIVPRRRNTEWLTRFGDIVLAATLLAFTLPLMAIVALAIKLEGPGPILDRQTCIGSGGRRFYMLTFRTAAYDPLVRAGCQQRPTLVGQFLSFNRIEALPQIINVLRGEVSILDRQGRSPSFLD